MRNVKKIAGIIALIAIIGLVAACGGGGGSSTTPGGGGTGAELSGTYMCEDGHGSLEFQGNTVMVWGHNSGVTVPVASGTYTISGKTVTITCTEVFYPVPGAVVGAKILYTIINDATLLNVAENQEWIKG